MKRLLTTMLICATLLASLSFASEVTERSDIKLIVNGSEIKNENVPIIVNSRTLIPLRDLVTKLGVTDDNQHIIWNETARTVTIIKDDTTINLVIDSDKALVNDKAVTLDAPAIIYNSRTYVPARFVGEALDKKIGWDALNNNVLVRDNPTYASVKDILSKSITELSNAKKGKANITITLSGITSPDNISEGSDLKSQIKNASLSATPTSTTLSYQIEFDAINKQMYCKISDAIDNNPINYEIYYANEEVYISEDGKTWVKSEDSDIQAFKDLFVGTPQMTVSDDNILYDILVIDSAKSTDKVIALKNDVSTLAPIVNALPNSEMLNATTLSSIKDFSINLEIAKATNYLQKMAISLTSEAEGVTIPLNATVELSDINGSFTVKDPRTK